VNYKPQLTVLFGERGSWDHITRARSNVYRLIQDIESAVID